MEEIANDYRKIRNDSPQITAMIDEIKANIDAFVIDESGSGNTVERRKSLLSQITKISKRVDDLKIFPAEITTDVETSLINLEDAMTERQGSLKTIDTWAMPGGRILAGNNACSEQGSGRWLPKPSDTLATFLFMAHPDQGYKGFPLLWFKMKPVSEMIGFLVPNWVANLVPGEHARHNDLGAIEPNLKDAVYNIATGNFNSFSVPIPTGHIWDSIMRVLAGLFLGIMLGVPLGLFMGLSRFAKGYFDPLIELYRPIPPARLGTADSDNFRNSRRRKDFSAVHGGICHYGNFGPNWRNRYPVVKNSRGTFFGRLKPSDHQAGYPTEFAARNFDWHQNFHRCLLGDACGCRNARGHYGHRIRGKCREKTV